MTLDAYYEILKNQDYKCAICSKLHEEDGRKRKRLVVDHDHKSGKVRGLLCNGCNIALGQLGDDIESVKNALSYLEKVRESDFHTLA